MASAKIDIKRMAEAMGNFIVTVLLYNLLPLMPFMFQYYYSVTPHTISYRSVVLAVATYSLGIASGTKIRTFAVFCFILAALTAGMYGATDINVNADKKDGWCIIFYFLVLFAVCERAYRCFYNNEICPLYKNLQFIK